MKLQAVRTHNVLNKAIVQQLTFDAKEKPTSVPRDYFRGSETDSCARKIFYARSGVAHSVPIDPTAQEKMRKGDRYQDYIRELIHNSTSFNVTNIELPITGTFKAKDGTEVKLSGRIDGILETEEGDRCLLEVKTTSHWGMMGLLKAKFQDTKHYTWGYVLQCHRYIAMLNQHDPEHPISKFCLYVYDVNGDACPDTKFPAVDFWYKFNNKLWHQEVERLAEIERNIQANQVPQRGYEEIDWQCSGCQYLFNCWPKGERKFAAPKHAKAVEELEATQKRSAPRSVSGRTPRSTRSSG